jgi:hypothetical protein
MMTRAGAILSACLILSQAAIAGDTATPKVKRAVFEKERASRDVRHMADWVVHAGDNNPGEIHPGYNHSGYDDVKLPFVILDKKDARVYVFNAEGRLLGAAPALLGIGVGDTALPGIGQQELSNIAPKDRVSPAGRFISEIGTDTHGEDVLWMDYEGGYAMHRVITTNPKERRAHRLATPTPLDNRISYGCINIPVKFYEKVVQPAFKGTKGVVYVLPETKPVHKVFALYDVVDDAAIQAPLQAAQSPVRRVSTDISR